MNIHTSVLYAGCYPCLKSLSLPQLAKSCSSCSVCFRFSLFLMLLLNALAQQFPNAWNVYTNKIFKTSFVELHKTGHLLSPLFLKRNYIFTSREQEEHHVRLETVLKIQLNTFLWKTHCSVPFPPSFCSWLEMASVPTVHR